jgi:hypothetical protein
MLGHDSRSIRIALAVSAVCFVTSCAGSLYKVKPVVELPAMTGDVKSATAGGVTVRVAPLMSDEESQDLFEANLPLSGILPLRLEMAFDSGLAVETKKVRFHLTGAAGREWKLVTAKAAIARILKANDIYAYNPNSRKQFEKEFAAYGLDLKSPLSVEEKSHKGFLFFEAPKGEAVENAGSLVLSIAGLPEPVRIEVR